MDLQTLIEELEEIIETSSKVPLTTKCMIDREEVWELIQQFRLNYPEEIKQAQYVKKERERIISEARQEANGIIETANQKVAMMVNETEIIKIAKQKAEDIVKEADMKAVEIHHAADEEAKEMIENAKDKIATYKLNAQEYASNLIAQAESVTVDLRDTVYKAYGQLSETYRESDSLFDKITSVKYAIAGSSSNEE